MKILLRLYIITLLGIFTSVICASETTKKQKANLKTNSMLQLKLYAALPMNDTNGIAIHKVYSLDGTLILECSSSQKKECIESIKAGKYTVTSSYRNNTLKTKLFVLDGANAYLYASFRSKNKSGETTKNNKQDEAREEARLARLEAQEERAMEEEARRAEAQAESESRRSFIDKMKEKRKSRRKKRKIPEIEDEQMLLEREREIMMSDPSMMNPEDMDMLEMQNERINRRRPPL